MPNLNDWNSRAGVLAVASQRKNYPSGALMAANQRAHAEITHSDAPSRDARGGQLRLLRTRQDMDPVWLATQACISVRQLYQLENGETSLFYSEGLRNQAGRRVAFLLGAQWDALAQLDQTTSAPAAVPDRVLRLVSGPAAATPLPGVGPSAPASTDPVARQDFPMGLTKPAADTVLAEVPVTAKIIHHSEPDLEATAGTGRSSWIWTLTGWLMAGAAGVQVGVWLVDAGVQWTRIVF